MTREMPARPFEEDAAIFFSKLIADAMMRKEHYKASLVQDHPGNQLKLVVELPLEYMAIAKACELVAETFKQQPKDEDIPY